MCVLYLNLNDKDPKFGLQPEFYYKEVFVPDRTQARAMALQGVANILKNAAALLDNVPMTGNEQTDLLENSWREAIAIVRPLVGALAETPLSQPDTEAATSTPSRSSSRISESVSSTRRKPST
jgi:hypothetical protein